MSTKTIINDEKAPSHEELVAQIKALEARLALSEREKTEAQEVAASMSATGQIIGGAGDEQPTGNFITVRRCTNPWERNEKKQKWVEEEVPTYYYTIMLPAGAGVSLTTNGIDYYHGGTYEFDPDTLTEMKSRVARCWDHEKSINGGDENAYRKPLNKHLMTAAAAARMQHR